MQSAGQKPLAVVTGASSGIGLELAKEFARNGFDLFITSGSSKIQRAKDEVKGAGATNVACCEADLTTFDGVEKLYQAIQATGRPVDAIAINAGVGVSGDFITETSLEEELDLIRLNVLSVVHLTKRVARDMVARGQGKILITSSIAALMPGPYFAIYAASKAFVQSFAQAIRSELQDTGVTVTSLQPGATDTNFFRRAGMQDTPVGKSDSKDDPEEVAKDGFKALMAGDDHVVAGSFKNKAQAVMSKFMPESTKAEMHRKQTEPDNISKKAS